MFKFFIIYLLTFILYYKSTFGFVPELCRENVTISKTCCPVPNGYNDPCGGKGRGVCEHISVHLELQTLASVFANDDRLHWPHKFFTKMCRCEGNYFGVACEQCWYGWTGPNCNIRHELLRRNINSLSKDEQQKFMHVVQLTNRLPSPFMVLIEKDSEHSDPLRNPEFMHVTFQQYIAYIHRYASRSTLFAGKQMCDYYGYLDNNHNVVAFGTWHRALMLFWERKLSQLAEELYGWKNFGIPYWDWIDAKECDVCRNDLVGATGHYDPKYEVWRLDHRNQFYNWTEYCSPPKTSFRCVGCHFNRDFPPLNRLYQATYFPTTQDLAFTLRHNTWYLPDEKLNQTKSCRSFHLALEGFCGRQDDPHSKYLYMHNRVHNMVRGSMCCAATASNDPLFILHHSSIDRIIECFFQLYSPSPTQLPNKGVEPGNCRECNVIGHIPPIRHAQLFLKMKELGIRYDNLNFGRHGFQCLRDGSRLKPFL